MKATSSPLLSGRAFRPLALALLLVGVMASAYAQATGAIGGTVYDAERNTNIAGARIKLSGTELTTVSDSRGGFRLSNVPAGPQTLEVSYLGSKPKSVPVTVSAGQTAVTTVELASDVVLMEKFQVTSYAGEQVAAINRQRQANTVSNILSSDAIGELPDENLRSALNRLPGINVAGGDDGEVSIRGMRGKLNAVVLDGDPLPSAATNLTGFGSQGETRGLDLSKIPTEAIQGIEVIKTATPDMDADFIGGRVDLKTANAFDFRERVARLTAEYKMFEFGGDGYSLNATYGDVLNSARTLGLFLNVSWRDYSRELGQHNLDFNNRGGAISGQAPILAEINPNIQYDETQAIAVNGSIDWKASDVTTVSFKGWFNSSDKLDLRDRVQIQLRDIAASNLTDAAGLTASGVGRVRVRKRHRFRPDREFDQLRFGAKGETVLADTTLAYGVNYGRSTFTASEYEYRFDAQTGRVPWSYDRRGDFELFSIQVDSGTQDIFNNPDAYAPDESKKLTRDNSDEDLTLNVDLTRHLNTANPLALKVGGKARLKDRSLDSTVRYFRGTSQFKFSNIALRPFSTYDRFQEFGFIGNDYAFRSYFEANMANPALFDERVAQGAQEEAETQQEIEENVWAGYGMATWDVGRLRLVGGLRYEFTDATYIWPASRSNRGAMVFQDVRATSRYGTTVPSALAIYRFNDNDVLRFGWSRTLARPDWDSLVPVDQSITFAVTDPSELAGGRTIEVGVRNPKLDPQRADNFDLSFEHYFGAGNLVSVGAFYKNMDNYIGSPIGRLTNVQARNPLTGAALVTDAGDPVFFEIYRPENGVQQKVKGAEISWQQRFNRLPGFLRGLGVNANYTYIRGDRRAPVFGNRADPFQITGYKSFDQLEDQPERIIHGQIYWEGHGISARVGYTQTGVQVTEFDRAGEADYIRDQLESVDVSLAYEFRNGWRLFAEGRNVTSEPVDARYYQTRAYLATYDKEGAEWTFGVRARF